MKTSAPQKEHRKEEHPATPERIRPELNIEKWSIWQPANARNQELEERVITRVFSPPDGTKVIGKLTIAPTTKGDLTTEDQKVYYGLVKLWEEKGRPDSFTPFSLRRLAKILKRSWNPKTKDSLEKSLVRLRGTLFVWEKAFEDGTKKQRLALLSPFNILNDLKILHRESDGHITVEGGYFRFDESILRNLAANYTKPVLFDVILSFKSDLAQILYTYLDLILSDKTVYERRTKELFEDLGLNRKGYRYPSKRKEQLVPALKELEGKPLTTGIITKAVLEKTKDDEDYKLVVCKAQGLAAIPATLESEQVLPLPTKAAANPEAEKLVGYFYFLFHKAREFHPTGKALEQATSLIARHGEKKARHIVEVAHRRSTETKFKIATFGGIIQYETDALQDYDKVEHERRKQEAAEQARREEQAARDHEETIQAQIRAYLDSLSDEAKSELDTQALAQATKEQRAQYENPTHQAFRTFALQGIRAAYVRKLFGLPTPTSEAD
jgi:hypothetical protein